jgi:aminoglycoside phosphotransferase (APT) family kinase protein
MISFNPNITENLVKELISEQFPEYAHLPIKSVEVSGHDNRTFHLGDEMLIRLPSAKAYADKVKKEQQWLPKLASHLSLAIPTPIAFGLPSKNYPWNWSIYNWLEGKSANCLSKADIDLSAVATNLANFLKELHKIDTNDALLPGQHNFWRGAHVSVYETEARASIIKLSDVIDDVKALSIWEEAVSSKWSKNPVWIHGDLASGNILIKNKQLEAVIDFGGMGIGDPACDLSIAWTFLDSNARNIFKSSLKLDADTWARAKGWTLWKATFELSAINDKTSVEAMKQFQIINDLIN